MNRPVRVPALLELVNDAQVSELCEVETSEGEAGTPRYGVVGSVWDSVFQWMFDVISERMGRMTQKGVLCARRQKFLLSLLSHHTAVEHKCTSQK